MSNSSLCPTHHCFQLVMMCYLSSCATSHRIQLVFVFNLSLCSTSQRIKFVIVSHLLWGGGFQQQKRSCRRENPKMSFVFFVLFCFVFFFFFFFSKHVQNRRFCAKFGQKRTKKIMIFVFYDLFCSFCRISLT